MSGISWWLVSHMILRAILYVVCNPLLYLGWILYAVMLLREGRYQRRFFGVRTANVGHAVWSQCWRSLVAGLVISVGCLVGGVVVQVWDVYLYTILVVLLFLLRLRWANATAAAGVLIILANGARIWKPTGLPPAIASLWNHVAQVSLYSWLCLAAILCFAEAILLLIRRNAPVHPVLVEGKRGRVIGALSIHLMYLVPVFVLVSGPAHRFTWMPHSWPWLGAESSSWGVLGMPFILGFGGVLTATKPRQASRVSAGYSVSLGVLAAGGAALALWYPLYGWVGGIVIGVGRELSVWWTKRMENQREPIYTPSQNGVRILAVVKSSLADQMGLHAGETITHVNQVPVHTAYDLHFAYSQNPAYVKLQVLDERGEMRLVGRPVYDGERAKFGLVATPEGQTTSCFTQCQFGLFHSLYLRYSSETWTEAGPTEMSIST